MHEWISDSNQTPHIVVDASMEGVEVPRQYVQGGKIILNVSSNATSMLSLGNEIVRFRARFGAATYDVSVPIAAVLGIYARETGEGLVFPADEFTPPGDGPAPEPPPPPETPPSPPTGRPSLKIVK